MINTKSLQTAIRKACFTLTNEGPYHYVTVYALYQDPARSTVAATAASNVITSSIPVVLGKRVNLAGFSITGEKFMIPDGGGFRVAATLADALAGVSENVADGSGTVFEQNISAEDDLEVLRSFQVASTTTSFLQEPPNSVEGDKAYLNINFAYLAGPVANLSHILTLISDNVTDNWWNPDIYPTLVYGLNPSTVSSIPIGQTLKVTIRPYMKPL